MIHAIKKENARLSIVGGIQTLVAVLANFDKHYEGYMNGTDAMTFQRLAIIRADVDSMISALGADRVVLDPQSKQFRWSENDQSPDGQWRSQGYCHESTNWTGYVVEVKKQPGRLFDVEWSIQKDGTEVLREVVVRVSNVNNMEKAKESALEAVKRITDEKEA